MSVVALHYVQNQSSFTKLENRRRSVVNLIPVIRKEGCALVIAATVALSGTNLTAAPPAIPSLKVLVADSNGKVAFKGATDINGVFSTGNLAAGNYVVQFNSSTATTTGHSYTLVIAAGKKKVSAQSIDGGKLSADGVAMKIAVASGSRISGQVAASNVKIDEKTKKMMVYIAPRTGSNMPGHWVPADSAEAIAAQNSGELRKEDIKKLQDQGDFRSGSTGN